MRFFLLFLLVGCSQLKYKYSSSKRFIASLTSGPSEVAKIEVKLKDKKVFASGLDSTILFVKLFDKDGNVLKDIDPAELTLSTSEDIEAKPFALKQGWYKSEILPRVKSKSIRMQVDWREKVRSPIVELVTTINPLKDKLEPVSQEYFENRYQGEISVNRSNGFPETGSEGFSFENVGENAIAQGLNVSRTFDFEYIEQARQNISLQVDDTPNGSVSHMMHSLFMFFPRKQLPIVEQLSGTLDVTLPTGEKMIFQKDTKEIRGGVFEEGPVDTKPEKLKRSFPDLRYKGKGVLLRANARGQSPELGSHEVTILNGTTGQKCKRPATDFWDTLDVSPIEFKFPTDEEFDSYLKSNCGFGLPKL